MKTVLWLLTVIGAVVGGMFLAGAFAEDSAPKQAASAAMAVAFAIIPYCLARARDKLDTAETKAVTELKGLNEKLTTHGDQLSALIAQVEWTNKHLFRSVNTEVTKIVE